MLKTNNLDILSRPQPGHFVQFYQSDTKLLPPLAQFISSGLLQGDTCVVIATRTHLQSLTRRLKQQGLDTAALHSNGQYITLDAAEMLATFMIGDSPDRELFLASVGSLVQKAADKGRPIRAYGEMVALLWKDSKREAVIQLESLWNELATLHLFSLYCAYPELHFVMDHEARETIDQHHTMTLQLIANS